VKTTTFRRGVRYFFGAVIILYPLLVFSALVIFKINIRYLSILLIILSVAYAVINKQHYQGRHPAFVFISPAILFIIGTTCFITPFFIESKEFSELLLKLYPALADLVYLTIFGTSLFIPPNLVYNLVNMFDKNLKTRLDNAYLERYCQKSTIIWCVFFVLDAALAAVLAFKSSNLVWAVYNSGITYIIMGLIFTAEYAFIKIIENYIITVIEKTEAAEKHNADC
jgi:uncharacterized membrane protein